MTSQRRGFSRERHNTMKAFVTAGSLVAFAGGWIGFSVSHGTGSQAPTAPTRTPEATVPPAPRGEVRPLTPAPAQQPTLPRARTSRGS